MDLDRISLLWTISDSDGDIGLLKSVKLAGEESLGEITCTGTTFLTCATYFENVDEGSYILEIKVWDSNAQVWSNIVTQEVEVDSIRTLDDNSNSDNAFGQWILPIGLALVAILLIIYLSQSRRE